MPPRIEGQLSDALIKGLSDPAIGIDRVGMVRVFNDEAGVALGIKPEEAIGRKVWEVITVSELSRAFMGQIKDSNKLIITPHLAWASLEARERCVEENYKNLEAFIKGEDRNVVC